MKRLFYMITILLAVALLAACASAPEAPPVEEPVTTPAPAVEKAAPTEVVKEAPPPSPTVEEVPTAEPEEEQTPLIILQSADVLTLDPQGSQSIPDINIKLNIFQTLTQYNDQIELEPYLADSWENIDPLTWEFKLKEGFTFHNGEPVNAEAVVFTLQRGLDLFAAKAGGVSYVYNLLNLDHAEVVDEYTVRIITKDVNPMLPNYLTEVQTAIMPPKYYSEATEEQAVTQPVGSGPYKFVEFVPDEHVILEAWDEYRDGPPPIKTLIWRPVPESATRIAELKSGNADVIVNVSPDLADDVDAADGVHLATVPGLRRIFVNIKQGRHPALADVRVRQALNYAFNCEAVMEAFIGGRGECSAHIINAPNWNPEVTSYPYDPEKAAALLDEAGWVLGADGIREKDGVKLSLGFDSPNGRYIKDKEIAQAIAADLEAVGIEVDFQVLEWSVLWGGSGNQGEGFRDLTFIGSGPGFNCRTDLALIEAASGSNRSGWSTEESEALFVELIPEMDLEKRKELCWEIEKVAFEDAPLIYVWLQTDFYGVSDRLDWQPRPDERMKFWYASFK